MGGSSWTCSFPPFVFIAAQKWTSIFKCLNYLRLVKNQLAAPWAQCLGLPPGRVWDCLALAVKGWELGRGQSGKGHCWVSGVPWDHLSWGGQARAGSGLCGSPCKAVRKDLAGLLARFGMLGQHSCSRKTRYSLEPLILGNLGPSLPPGTNPWATYNNPGSSEEVSPPLSQSLRVCIREEGPIFRLSISSCLAWGRGSAPWGPRLVFIRKVSHFLCGPDSHGF